MADARTPLLALDLPRMLRLWQIDPNSLRLLKEFRPVSHAALAGHEAEFVDALLADAADEVGRDLTARRHEAVTMAGLWYPLLGGDLDLDRLDEVAAFGRRFLALGIEARAFFTACQRIMRRVVAAVIDAASAERDAVVDAISRAVLLVADVALAAHYDGVVGQVREREVHRETEQLQEQLRALEELAHVDPLTRLYNRRHFDETLTVEIARAERGGLPLSLVLGDLDQFRRIVTDFGAAAGDLVLTHVAGLMRETARRSDVLSRCGGDRFALILTGTGADNALLFAQRLRSVIATRSLPLSDGRSIDVTISLGVAGFTGSESAASLLERADAALQRAKTNGRDRAER